MRTLKTGFLLASLLLGLLPSVMAQTAKPYPSAATPKAIDLGELKAESGATPISITIALHLRDLNGAEDLLKSINTPGDAQYHQFLTADQFATRFAPSAADIAKVSAALAQYGLTVERTTATTLKVTGLPAAMENAFSVSLHSYEVPAHGSAPAYTYHAPLSAPTSPAEISASAASVVGLDSRPTFRPANRTVSSQMKAAGSAAHTTTPDQPGFWTVTDFADYYDVNPLYQRGLTGRGRTLGIMTLASFTPSDAFAYWSALGLNVNPNRLTVVNIDGGPGAPSDASGSVETTLDVEQSGGIAPGAKIIVYQAPNTNQGFIDLFAAAVEANKAETLSTSWYVIWEWFANLENYPVTDPTTGQVASFAQASHELFVRAALQGQTVFAASGDGGAYNANDYLGCFGPFDPSNPNSCSLILSIAYPPTDPAITAAGGTTVPTLLELCQNQACTPPYYDITIAHERVWGWDYLTDFCEVVFGADPIACGIFPAGSGGGVSIMFHEPHYQHGLRGVQRSQPDQVFEGLGLYYALPAFYRGRNVPDVSMNADPESGYIIYYTSEPSGVSGVLTYYGGTSFVAPQLNGVSALLGEDLHSRLGLLNYPLYELAQNGDAYGGHDAPLRAIRHGDNWFYHGSDGYNPAAGVGTMDVANFARVLRHRF